MLGYLWQKGFCVLTVAVGSSFIPPPGTVGIKAYAVYAATRQPGPGTS